MIDLKELRKLAEQIQEYRELLKQGRSFISENQFAHLMDCLAMLNMKEIIVALNLLEAAEKVCDAVTLITVLCEIEDLGKWELRKANDLLQKALKTWQEVVKCADQQQKK